jgi:hypothetical protein
MKRLFIFMSMILGMFLLMSNSGCNETAKPSADKEQLKQTEIQMMEAQRQVGMPAIVNFQEKKQLRWIYELCDQENMICHAYLFNELKGEVGQYLGQCIGYGIPYSTQFSNPQKLVDVNDFGIDSYQANDAATIPQAEPNGLFKPDGMSATWLIMLDPETKEPRPVYVEPQIIVSPFKLK